MKTILAAAIALTLGLSLSARAEDRFDADHHDHGDFDHRDHHDRDHGDHAPYWKHHLHYVWVEGHTVFHHHHRIWIEGHYAVED